MHANNDKHIHFSHVLCVCVWFVCIHFPNANNVDIAFLCFCVIFRFLWSF